MRPRHTILAILAATTALTGAQAAPDDGAPLLWGLQMIDRDYAISSGFTGAGVKVGVFDEAARITHQEFADRWMGGFNVDGSPYGPTALHGTHVAGTIGGTNVGVAPGSLLYGINWSVLNGDAGYSAGFWWGLDQGIRLFNNSWELQMTDGGGTRTRTVADITREDLETYLPLTVAALFDSAAAGSVQVFATGNSALGQPSALAGMPFFFPELQPHWIAVTAVGPDGTLASYANMCGVAASWCMAAPGGDGTGNDSIWSAGPDSDDYYVAINGTSMATPHVTGAMAVAAEIFPDATYPDIAQLVLQTATDIGEAGVDSVYGWGLLNMRNLVDTIDPVTGAVFSGAAWSRFAALDHVTQALKNRIGAAPVADDADQAAPLARAAWLMPVYGTARLGAGPASPAHRGDTAGLLAGLDLVDDAAARFGLAGGYTSTRLSSAADDAARADMLHLGAYGHVASGAWFADGTAQLARFDHSITRRSIAGAADTSATPVGRASVTGYGAEASLRAGYSFALAGHGTLSPYAAMTARWQHAGAASETGAGAFGLDLASASHGQFEAGPGLRLETAAIPVGAHALRLTVDLAYARLAGDRALATPVELLGREIDARGAAVGRDVLRLGADLDLTPVNANGLNWVAAYDGAFQHGASAHTFALSARMRF